jgi:hypothetical protein
VGTNRVSCDRFTDIDTKRFGIHHHVCVDNTCNRHAINLLQLHEEFQLHEGFSSWRNENMQRSALPWKLSMFNKQLSCMLLRGKTKDDVIDFGRSEQVMHACVRVYVCACILFHVYACKSLDDTDMGVVCAYIHTYIHMTMNFTCRRCTRTQIACCAHLMHCVCISMYVCSLYVCIFVCIYVYLEYCRHYQMNLLTYTLTHIHVYTVFFPRQAWGRQSGVPVCF